MPSPKSEHIPILAFGAHPDDVEFGCGGVIAEETQAGRAARIVICSKGESGTHGTPRQRQEEARRAAGLLGATVEFLDLGGDAHIEADVANTLRIAEVIRRVAPALVLAPTAVVNQHPDHSKLGTMVRDAARLARYGGVKELRGIPPHAVQHLLSYAITPGAEQKDAARVLIDVSGPKVMAAWKASMDAHATQARVREYVELQLTRARLNGLLAGVEYAIALWPNDDLVFDSLDQLGLATRRF